jgi:hypothetical protein
MTRISLGRTPLRGVRLGACVDAARAKRFSGEGCNHHTIDIRTTWMIYNDNRRGGQD